MATLESVSKSKSEVDGDDVRNDVAEQRKDVERLFGDMTKIARQQIDSGAESGAHLKDAVEHQITDASEAARVYVRDNPIGACAAAAAAGFAIALLMKR